MTTATITRTRPEGFILICHMKLGVVDHRMPAATMYGPDEEAAARAEAQFHNADPGRLGSWHVYRVEEIP